ncbi:MAG: response regulator transcription factor [Gammaproteobacteria bacterium]|nr:response regulator transcription factor [Gammaproteobacteria bacterium]
MKTPAILIVEDDRGLLTGLKDNLEIEGYRVLTAGTAKEGRDQALAHRPDLILLDVMLPDGDGISLCRQLRRHGLRQPIIMLTARGEEHDKLLGFEVGADDYVVKPFSLRELLARIHARLRVLESPPTGGIMVGVAMVDFERHTLMRNHQPLEISAKELELLRYLTEHRGQVVSRDDLLNHVWGHQGEITTRTIDNFIVRLRKKIEPDPANPLYLITVYGSGYKLVEQSAATISHTL